MLEFGWIFAIIVGAVILFLAFYFIGTTLFQTDIFKGYAVEHSFDIILNPFSYFGGLGASAAKNIDLGSKANLSFSCSVQGDFGYNSIQESDKVQPRLIYDKYVIAPKYIQGRRFQVISKPFVMPWRIVDLIYIIPVDKRYCFVKLPEIEEDFGEGREGTGMNISVFEFISGTGTSILDCSPGSVTICNNTVSGSSTCDITIYSDRVIKKNYPSQAMYYIKDLDGSNALMYAAIFSDPEIYNCTLKRIVKRLNYQVDIYDTKVMALNTRQCSISINSANLNGLKQKANTILESTGQIPLTKLNDLKSVAQTLDNLNTQSSCSLF